jgi:hypothetical protein
MSAELHRTPHAAEEAVQFGQPSPTTRRGFLFLASGLVTAAIVGGGGGCSSEGPDGRLRSLSGTGGVGGDGEAEPYPSPDSAPSPGATSEVSPSPSGTPEQGRKEVAI